MANEISTDVAKVLVESTLPGEISPKFRAAATPVAASALDIPLDGLERLGQKLADAVGPQTSDDNREYTKALDSGHLGDAAKLYVKTDIDFAKEGLGDIVKALDTPRVGGAAPKIVR